MTHKVLLYVGKPAFISNIRPRLRETGVFKPERMLLIKSLDSIGFLPQQQNVTCFSFFIPFHKMKPSINYTLVLSCLPNINMGTEHGSSHSEEET